MADPRKWQAMCLAHNAAFKAGYNPKAAPNFFKMLQKHERYDWREAHVEKPRT